MMEGAKSLLLAVLVAASLVQSYLLVYSAPKFDAILPTDDYVESKLEGTRAELTQLIFPKDIVLHFGNGEHTVVYPGMIFYDMILDVVEQRAFDGLRPAIGGTVPVEANIGEAFGIEVRFAEELPLTLLRQRMNLQGDGLPGEEPIDRIHIFTQPGREDVRVFMSGRRSGTVFESTRADFTAKDVERFVGFGEARVRYAMLPGGHYVPEAPLPMVKYRASYRLFTADQLMRSLFPDPFNTRNLTERSGSEIYTDGKRGLQLSNDSLWMSYTDPAAPSEGGQTPLDAALSAVQFVNRHGGWNGLYALETLRRDDTGSEYRIAFRHYIGTYPGSYPIIGTPNGGAPFGPIQLSLRNRAATSYERSTVQLEGDNMRREPMELPGGERLLALWNAFEERGLVEALYPAYRAVLTEDDIVLEPVWAFTMRGGEVRALPGGGAY